MSGMMSGNSNKLYNNVVKFEGGEVEVKNGVADIGGSKYYVSDDGELVIDEERNFVGTIQDGVFYKATPEIIDQLKDKGYFE